MITWQAGKLGYQAMWRSCRITELHQSAALRIADRLAKPENRDRYAAVAMKTNTPWWMVAAIHERESSGDFTTQLWQGDPLDKVSTHEPEGKGPYKSWEQCAVQAIRAHKSNDDIIDTPAKAAWYCEDYNGWGPQVHGVNSSYVWSWTNHQQPGKYPRDHYWDPHYVDTQPGCAALWRALQIIGVDINDDTHGTEKPMAQTVPAQPPVVHDLEKTLSTIRQVAGFANLIAPIIPARWRPLYALIPLLVEDAARWIEAARNPQTSSDDVAALISMTATHAGSVVSSLKAPAQQ